MSLFVFGEKKYIKKILNVRFIEDFLADSAWNTP